MAKKSLLIGILFLGLFIYRLPLSFFFDTDFARDLYQIALITQGKLTLVGPILRLGIFSGPYYYYLFTPPLGLSQLNPYSLPFFNSFLFALALSVYHIIHLRRFGARSATLTTVALGMSPVYLASARHPGNAYSYLPFLLIFITITIFSRRLAPTRSAILGFLAGIIFNFHPSTLPVLVSLFFYLYLRFRPHTRAIVLTLLSFTVTLLPTLFFEIRHGFVVSKGLIITRNFVPLFQEHSWPTYYLYPLMLLAMCTLTYSFSRAGKSNFLLVLIIILLALFPFRLFTPSPFRFEIVESAVDFVLEHRLVSQAEPFNLLHIIDVKHLVPAGHIFRFAFLRRGLKPLPESEYNRAAVLLIFSEDPDYPISSLDTWETQQFGQRFLSLSTSYRFPRMVIYRAAK